MPHRFVGSRAPPTAMLAGMGNDSNRPPNEPDKVCLGDFAVLVRGPHGRTLPIEVCNLHEKDAPSYRYAARIATNIAKLPELSRRAL